MISGLLGILVFTPMEVSTEVMWCAKQPGDTHISYCFEKEKECEDFIILKKNNGSKHPHYICRPKKI